jgi:hypothetical protein
MRLATTAMLFHRAVCAPAYQGCPGETCGVICSGSAGACHAGAIFPGPLRHDRVSSRIGFPVAHMIGCLAWQGGERRGPARASPFWGVMSYAYLFKYIIIGDTGGWLMQRGGW